MKNFISRGRDAGPQIQKHSRSEGAAPLARHRRSGNRSADAVPLANDIRVWTPLHPARRPKISFDRRGQRRSRPLGNRTRSSLAADPRETALVDYKSLLTKVERTLETIESAESMRFTVAQIAETIAANFRDELGITGGRIYERNDDQNYYELVSRFGKVQDGALGIAVPKDY